MAEAVKGPQRRQRRQMKNFLLDRGLQLKYAGYLMVLAAVLSAALGTLLWRTSQSLLGQSREAVRQSEQVVALSRDVAAESKKVSEVVKMNIVKDPVYSDNPELLAAFKKDADKQDATIRAQQEAMEAQAKALEGQSANIEAQQRTMFLSLLLILGALVVGVGLVGIVVTHKVAGPLFKMTRQIRTVAGGTWKMPDPLRKGDELTGFFGEFESMVRNLREQREEEIELLADATENARRAEALDAVERLEKLHARMSKVLGA